MHIEHVAFQVSDPVAMAQWYVQHLGCSIARSTGEPAFIHFLKDASGQALLEIYRNPRCSVPDYKAMDVMQLHVAFYPTIRAPIAIGSSPPGRPSPRITSSRPRGTRC